VLDPEYKVNIYVKIAQLYLEEDESVQAETFLNRASILIPDCKDPILQMRYKVQLFPRQGQESVGSKESKSILL